MLDESKSPFGDIEEQYRAELDARDAQSHPGDLALRELYEDWIREDLDYIKFLNSVNKTFQELRENHQGNWEVVELCREALFDNAKLINLLKERIEDARGKIKELGSV